mgnify:CR=1 FL=1
MTTIIKGQAAKFTVTIMTDGVALPIASSAAVETQLFTADGRTALFNPVPAQAGAVGANWAQGVVAVSIDDGTTGSLVDAAVMLVVTGPGFLKRFKLTVEAADVPTHSALFVRDFVIDEIRRDQLAIMAQSFFAGLTLSDDFLWQKILAAEASISHELRVPLCPTQFFPNDPSQQQIDALDGMPWAVDPGYDYDPEFFRGEKWGYIVTRQKPIISVSKVEFVYPRPDNSVYEFPLDWLRMDKKYGHMRFVPASSSFAAPLGAFMLQALGGGRTIPFAIEVTYVAGLSNVEQTYPDLIDAVKKMAVLKIIEDGFLPQSGSISADGLSQSMSADMEKYRDTIETILNGPKGSNGGLMTAIHGIRTTVLGA